MSVIYEWDECDLGVCVPVVTFHEKSFFFLTISNCINPRLRKKKQTPHNFLETRLWTKIIFPENYEPQILTFV